MSKAIADYICNPGEHYAITIELHHKNASPETWPISFFVHRSSLSLKEAVEEGKQLGRAKWGSDGDIVVNNYVILHTINTSKNIKLDKVLK